MIRIFANTRLLRFIGLSFLSSLACMNTAMASRGEALDGIVAIVNDTPIMQTDLDNALENAKRQIAGSNMPMPPADVLRKQVLDQTVNRQLQLQLAEQGGLKITDADVDKTISGIAANNHIDTKELLEKVSMQGMSVSEYKKEIREEMIIQQVQQSEVSSHITISPQEVDDYMHSAAWQTHNDKEYHLEDILIALPENPTPADISSAKKRADAVIHQLSHGTSFQEAAAANTEGNTDVQGGDLGWRQLPQIPTAFSGPLLHMKEGEVMGPISTSNGFHIVKLSGVRSTGTPETLAEQRKQAEQAIFQHKMEEGVQVWLAKVRGAAFINMHPETI